MTNPTVSISWPFLELDSKGRVRIAGTRIRLTMIVEARYAHGWSPEEIHFQYPILSLAQVYSALSYYYAHQEEIEQEIANEQTEIEEMKVKLRELGTGYDAEEFKAKLLAKAKAREEKAMTVAYYFDEPVNQAICKGLRLRDVEVITAQDDNKRATDDREILARATALNRPLVTADRDFLAIATTKLQQSEPFSGVILLLSQELIGYAVENLEIYAKTGEIEDFMNEVIYI